MPTTATRWTCWCCAANDFAATIVQCYPIGVINMSDEGEEDSKIIAIPFKEPTYNCYTDIEQLPKHIFEEMRHFFKVYKQLEHKHTAVSSIMGRADAIEIIEKSIIAYNETFPQK